MQNNNPPPVLSVLLCRTGGEYTPTDQNEPPIHRNNAGNIDNPQPALLRSNAVNDLTQFNRTTPSYSTRVLDCLSFVVSRICGRQ